MADVALLSKILRSAKSSEAVELRYAISGLLERVELHGRKLHGYMYDKESK